MRSFMGWSFLEIRLAGSCCSLLPGRKTACLEIEQADDLGRLQGCFQGMWNFFRVAISGSSLGNSKRHLSVTF